MRVKHIMHRGVTCVQPSTSVRTIAKYMRDVDIGAMPVQADGHLVGIVTDRDITCRALANGRDVTRMTAADIMTRRIVSCSVDDDVNVAIKKMETKKVRRLPVLDGHSAVAGMLSLGDISRKVTRQASGEVLHAVSRHHA